ncbi:ribosome small subunit-dependent GTPase A [Flexithrix dorotheae]|uniref:ribosome small subunit-dependent GTPase A n=1 Tax=Flexithrix dorotheae TaxID=70993 RepID=UPI00036EED09|nr:ribosome small subunit-dependent GTPase A [Flexithrix dorotheae]
MKKGLIIRSTGSWYDILDDNNKVIKGRLRGKLKLKGFKRTNPIAVGDYVDFEMEKGEEDSALIKEIHDRSNYIIRQSTHKKWDSQIIAANIDLAIIIFTLKEPKTSLGFLDRFLVSAESFQVPVLIVFNKADLLSDEDLEYQKALESLYTELGYQCILISALEGTDLSRLQKILKGKKNLIAGHSGVGKSTIINQMIPDAQQRTSEISDFANKGVHTTTFAEMFRLDEDTFLIDTPGIKELGIIDLEENELGFYFPEIRELTANCKFYNCTHVHEPGCAVIKAVEEDELVQSRYFSYLSILENEDNRR